MNCSHFIAPSDLPDVCSIAALLAVGLKARQLGLKTRDVETTKMGAGHVLSDFFNFNLQRC
jgi:hypothetical protein